LPSALPILHTSSTPRALGLRRKATHPPTKGSYRIVQHHPRINAAKGLSLLRLILRVFHSTYKKPNAPVMHRVRAHPARPMRQERPVREGGNSQSKLSHVHAHIRRPIHLAL
jgi:hypothetical protein